jgi:uncharacterized membrane protein (UPF0136 family)
MEFILWCTGIGAVIGGVIGYYRFNAVINICGWALAKEYQANESKKTKLITMEKYK